MINVNVVDNYVMTSQEYEISKCRMCGEKKFNKDFSPEDYAICESCYEDIKEDQNG